MIDVHQQCSIKQYTHVFGEWQLITYTFSEEFPNQWAELCY